MGGSITGGFYERKVDSGCCCLSAYDGSGGGALSQPFFSIFFLTLITVPVTVVYQQNTVCVNALYKTLLCILQHLFYAYHSVQ